MPLSAPCRIQPSPLPTARPHHTMMSLNSPKGGGFLLTNGNSNTTTYRLELQSNTAKALPLKMHTKGIYTGKLKNISYIVVHNDRIMLMNLKNKQNPSKFNITIPFLEIIALRYCFTSDIGIFVIQPIQQSYEKLSNWMNTSMIRTIPENFVMVHFDKNINSEQLSLIQREAKKNNPNMKFIEINSTFAQSYLSSPNKTTSVRKPVPKTLTVSNQKPTNHEVIHLEDSDEEDDTTKAMLNCCILKYPNNEPNPIILYGNDLNCLRDGHYLNDNIMNFYLKYYQHHKNENDDENCQLTKTIAPELMNKIHIYDALFATHLLNNNRKRKFSLENIEVKAPIIVYTQESFSDTYQKVLKKWTKDIDIFSKDFLFIPLIKDSHWFLVILCYIGNLVPDKSNGASKGDPNSKNTQQRPTIIFMDSLNQYAPRNEISVTITKYLACELKEKRNMSGDSLNSLVLDELYPKVPQQQNYYDCGLFVLEYIERFLSSPEDNFNLIRSDSRSLAQWFDPKSLDTKRAKIRQIILNFLKPEDAATLESELQQINLSEANGIMMNGYMMH